MPDLHTNPDLVAHLEAENVVLRDENVVLREQVAQLVVRVAGLEERLRMNSQNSSKPPSSDGYSKPAPKSRRKRSGKKPGKQRGDPGRHLAQRDVPDDHRTHTPERCRACDRDLSDAEVTGATRRQVFDLPPVTPLVCIEHVAQRKLCVCGVETSGEFPVEATAPACYGPELRALVCYLVTRQHIPIARVAELLRDIYGAPVSTGTVVAMVQEGAALLDPFLMAVKELLRGSAVVHADETGLRVEAGLKWVHSVSTTDLTLYHLNTKRGRVGMDAMGVLGYLRGVLVHDGWAPYRLFTMVLHALCNAHHLRELIAVAESAGQGWANDMAGLLCDALHLVLEAKENGKSALETHEIQAIHTQYRTIIAAGHTANPPPEPTGKRGRPKRSTAGNLLCRLDDYTDEVLRFATDFSVPWDNNLAERDIRMVKIAQKISGGFRSDDGAEAFLAFRSYISTAAKQGVNRLDALQRLFKGSPWIPSPSAASP
jgi:transposase